MIALLLRTLLLRTLLLKELLLKEFLLSELLLKSLPLIRGMQSDCLGFTSGLAVSRPLMGERDQLLDHWVGLQVNVWEKNR